VGNAHLIRVGAVAELAGVSVRTLHHHDELGLLAPTERSPAGYRLYSEELSARKLGLTLTPAERLEVFGSTQLEDNADLAEQRWGGSEQWDQRRERVARYTAADWQELRTEQAGIHQRLLDAMRAGTPATDPAVMALAEEHRCHLGRWLHDCPPEVHRTLAAAYLANERIGRNYDDVAPGLSRYVHDAIVADAGR
jgi:DNA-binding transcriptional MerR regulator